MGIYLHTSDLVCELFPFPSLRVCDIPYSIQDSHALDVAGLREEVEAPDALDLVPRARRHNLLLAVVHLAPDQHADVSGLRVHIAAHVYHTRGAKGEQLAQERCVAPLSGRVDDDGR